MFYLTLSITLPITLITLPTYTLSMTSSITDTHYSVNSQSGNDAYDVLQTELGWICSCPDHMYRGVRCKHIYAVEFSLAIRKEVSNVVINELNTLACIRCNSNRIVKDSIRRNKNYDIQRYLCKECGQR